MAHRSQCSDAGDNPLDPNYLPPHYREEYRLAVDALIEENLESYYEFLQIADVVDFLSRQEIKYIQGNLHLPQLKAQPELPYLESVSDGSSDTYWPVHSDLDAPGLDLGWPQVHHFIGPTEVTTLVNPSEPDMPSIKEQARRLIKNAQQVIAVVMDMFTDVDIFSDIIDAAMRNVAVYILLDEHNAEHFTNMVLNCRVNLDSIQSMRVRTVSGITYHCRSGKSFKGQMMDRYLLIDCRAVLSGNYSFTWSFEKIHRCIAHLFLGQLVATFDEEFRILYAQSTPLVIENVTAPEEDLSNISSRHYTSDSIPSFRDPRQPLPFGSSYPEDRARQPFEEHMDVDWKTMPPRRHEPIQRPLEHGPGDLKSSKLGPQPLPIDQSYVEPGYPKMPKKSTVLQKHSYADRTQGRQGSHQFKQQKGLHPLETQGRPSQRDQYQYPRTGPEPGFRGYDKFKGQGYPQMDEYSDPQCPSDMESLDSYDPVFNYLSSTGAVETEQDSDRLLPPGEVPYGQSNPKRLSIGQPYACQKSPTSALPEQKPLILGPSIDRKDPSVKQGLRNWRISSYLSAFDDTVEEDLPVPPPIGTDPFEEPPNPLPHRHTGVELTIPRFKSKEFKIPTASRVSQLSCYTKPTVPDHIKKLPEDFAIMEPEAKTTPKTPSVSSSNNDEDKAEELEKKEEIKDVVKREESFKRKYIANIQRNSRLRSSLIFSSQLEQHISEELKPTPGNDEETSKDKDDQTKCSIATPVLGKRRPLAREPFEWSGYKKTSSFDSSTREVPEFSASASKESSKDSQREEKQNEQVDTNAKEQSKITDMEQGKVTQWEPPPIGPMVVQPIALPMLSNPSYVDMDDADCRLMFFKQLAAKRKAAKAAALESSSTDTSIKTSLPIATSESKTSPTDKKDKPAPLNVSKSLVDSAMTMSTEPLSEKTEPTLILKKGKFESLTETCETSPFADKKRTSEYEKVENRPKSPSLGLKVSCDVKLQGSSTDAEKIKLKSSIVGLASAVLAEEPKLSTPAPKELSPSIAPLPRDTKLSDRPALKEVAKGSSESDANPALHSADSGSPSSTLVEPSCKSDKLGCNTQPELVQSECRSSHPSPPESYLSPKHVPADSSPSSASFPLKTNNALPSLFPQPTPSDSSSPHSMSIKSSSYNSIKCKTSPTPTDLFPSPVPGPSETCLSISCLDSLVSSPNHDDKELVVSPIPKQSPSASPQLPSMPTSPQPKCTQSKSLSPTTAVSSTFNMSASNKTVLSSKLDQKEILSPSNYSSAEPSLSSTSTESNMTHGLPSHDSSDQSSQTLSEPSSNIKPLPVESSMSLNPTIAESSCSSIGSHLEIDVSKIQGSDMLGPVETGYIRKELASPDSLAVKKTVEAEAEAANAENKTSHEETMCHRTQSEETKERTETLENTSEEVNPSPAEPKQSKVSQSRYLSSTANILSSSNLRDDTKLLLEQISRDSQIRTELPKAAATDDEKEDEADKSGGQEGVANARLRSRGQHRNPAEREQLLNKIQNMRKERKVYSRFEMAP